MFMYYRFFAAPTTTLLLATKNQDLCWLTMGDNRQQLLQELQQHYPTATLKELQQPLEPYESALNQYYASGDLAMQLPLDLAGTPWQLQVWEQLRAIPTGQVISYSELAARCHNPKAVRAAASACARNPISLFVPCHRVVAKSGGLGGYLWGLDLKKQLLALEGYPLETFKA